MNFKKPKFWDYKKLSFWSTLLLPLSVIYLLIITLKKILSKFKTYPKNSHPIICVGNIYLGGTGKTPLVKEIFKHNKRFELGWMKINPKGLMTFAFKFGDLETNYYLVRNQNQ